MVTDVIQELPDIADALKNKIIHRLSIRGEGRTAAF